MVKKSLKRVSHSLPMWVRRTFWFLCVCLIASALAQYFLYSHGDVYLTLLRFHSYLGVPGFLLLLVFLFFETRRISSRRFALLIAFYPFFCIFSLMTPSPLIIVFIFNITFVPIFLYLVVHPSVKGQHPMDFARKAMLVYFLAVTFFTGFFSMVDPILLRFEYFHRRVHGYYAFMLLVYLGYFFFTSLAGNYRITIGTRRSLVHFLLIILISFPVTQGFKWIRESRIQAGYERQTVSTHVMAHREGKPFQPIDGTLLESSIECRKCHPIPYRQWARSVHAFSSRNLSFQKTAKSLIEQEGPELARHCAVCHDPAVALSEDPLLLIDPEHVNKSEGVSCRSCHYMVHQGEMDGAYKLAIARSDVLYKETEKRQRYILTSVLEHVQDMTKPITKDGTQCYPCHRLNVRKRQGMVVPVDNVTSFIESPFATKFDLKCHDCHMPRLVRDERSYTWKDHQFLGIQTFLPHLAINVDDKMQTEVEKFTLDNHNWLFGKLQSVAPLEMFMDETFKSYRLYNYAKAYSKIKIIRKMLQKHSPFEIEMESYGLENKEGASRLDLVFSTTNETIGHEFPSALFANIVECWFQLKVSDRDGKVIYLSAAGADNENSLGRIEIDKNGHAILPHESPLYVGMKHTDRYLQPMKKYKTEYSIPIPAEAVFPLHVSYALNYRRYADTHTQWITDADLMEVPTIMICSADFTIHRPEREKREES